MKTVAPSSQQTMQRVKVGMIGLAAVVLLIGLASAIFSTRNHEQPIAVVGAPDAETVANLTISNTAVPTEHANEPLAELGVAPGTVDANATTAQPPIQIIRVQPVTPQPATGK